MMKNYFFALLLISLVSARCWWTGCNNGRCFGNAGICRTYECSNHYWNNFCCDMEDGCPRTLFTIQE